MSGDTAARQRQIDAKHHLGYRLLSDAEGTVASAYGAQRNLSRVAAAAEHTRDRLRPPGAGVIRSELRMEAHADELLRILGVEGPPAPG